MLRGQRIVDLSRDLRPGQEEYGLDLDTRFVDEVYPGYRRRPDVWYAFQTLRMGSHVGTHVEFPRHFDPSGLDAASFPLDLPVGPACVLDIRCKLDDEAITLADLQARDDLVQLGDVVFLHTGRHVAHNTPEAHSRPFLTPEAVRWLVEAKRVRVVGVNATGIEVKRTNYRPDHSILLKEYGCALIEAVGDLSQLRHSRFQVWVLPLKMHGLHSSPIGLWATGIPVAIASGSSRPSILPVLARFGIEADALVTAEDVTRCKPYPDLLLCAAERLDVEPQDCVVVEDSDAGIEAARNAGMQALRFYDN